MNNSPNISRYLYFGLGRLGGVGDANSLMSEIIVPALNWIVGFSVVVAVIMIIVSGYTLMTSGGDSEKVQKGQRGLTAAIIGMVIVFITRILLIFLLDLVGVR